MEHPKIGVGVILQRDGKVLMQRRKGSHGDGTWSFPGGHMEYGETPQETAKRETMEEVGITLTNLRLGPYTNDIFDEGKHYLTLFILGEPLPGEEPKILEPEKTTELGWFTWEELPVPLFLPVQNLLEQEFSPFE
jgi:8-oxo-dGTP diphosphatase